MKKLLVALAMTSVFGLAKADDARPRAYVCSTWASNGDEYKSEDRSEEKAMADSAYHCKKNVIDRGLGKCFESHCTRERRADDGKYWLCVAKSNRGFEYKWQYPEFHNASVGALGTCQQYEETNGLGKCAKPLCSEI